MNVCTHCYMLVGVFSLQKEENFSDGSDRVCMLYFTREVYIGMYTTAYPPPPPHVLSLCFLHLRHYKTMLVNFNLLENTQASICMSILYLKPNQYQTEIPTQ